jgi:hypothetical protein
MNYNTCKSCHAEVIGEVFWSNKKPYCLKCIKILYPYKSDEGIADMSVSVKVSYGR